MQSKSADAKRRNIVRSFESRVNSPDLRLRTIDSELYIRYQHIVVREISDNAVELLYIKLWSS